MNDEKREPGVPEVPEPVVGTETRAPDAAAFAAETLKADEMRGGSEAAGSVPTIGSGSGRSRFSSFMDPLPGLRGLRALRRSAGP